MLSPTLRAQARSQIAAGRYEVALQRLSEAESYTPPQVALLRIKCLEGMRYGKPGNAVWPHGGGAAGTEAISAQGEDGQGMVDMLTRNSHAGRWRSRNRLNLQY